MHMFDQSRFRAAAIAFSWHLIVSVVVALSAGALVLLVWFPTPFRELTGGTRLFWILVGVDLICGPLLTFVIFDKKKSKKELTCDLSLVALIQMTALVYGLYSISLARPVILAFETDRFVVVSAVEIDPKALSSANISYRDISWRGPKLVGVRSAKNGDERWESIWMSLQGVEPSARPDWWVDFETNRKQVQQRMRPLPALQAMLSSNQQITLTKAISRMGIPAEQLSYLPLVSKKVMDDWCVLLNSDGEIVGYLPVGGFR